MTFRSLEEPLMKITFLIDTLGSGGKERQLIELLKGLSARDDLQCQLIVLSRDVHYSHVDDLNVEVHYLVRKVRKDPGIFVQLFKRCKAFHSDILHSWDSMSSVYALPVARALSLRFVNGMIRNAPREVGPLGAIWVRSRLTFPFSDAIVANSYAGLKAYKVPEGRGVCIHNGFDFGRVRDLCAAESVREKFSLDDGKVVGMVARFDDLKDYATFIQSALRLLREGRNVTFLAVGEGYALDRYKRMVPTEFRERIRFPGKQTDIESLVNVFDVGVLATHEEAISNSIMEYMALAKPVVATNLDGTGEIVVHDQTGFLVEPANVEEMAARIRFLLDNRDTAQMMGEAGRRRIIREFGLERMTQKYMELYRSLVDAGESQPWSSRHRFLPGERWIRSAITTRWKRRLLRG
jgi:glycosyltransferase involved in cell wall biosynthesis